MRLSVGGMRFRRFGGFFLGFFRRLTNNTNYLIRGGWDDWDGFQKQFRAGSNLFLLLQTADVFLPFSRAITIEIGSKRERRGKGRKKSSINSGKNHLPSLGRREGRTCHHARTKAHPPSLSSSSSSSVFHPPFPAAFLREKCQLISVKPPCLRI